MQTMHMGNLIKDLSESHDVTIGVVNLCTGLTGDLRATADDTSLDEDALRKELRNYATFLENNQAEISHAIAINTVAHDEAPVPLRLDRDFNDPN